MKDGYGADNHRQRWELNTNLLNSVLGQSEASCIHYIMRREFMRTNVLQNEDKRVVKSYPF